MPKLILIRHAKSDWNNSASSDHARPLNERGRAAAPLVGKELMARGHVPTQVLCSSAARTQETWGLIAAQLPNPSEPEIHHDLYLASPDTMLDRLQQATGDTVAMIAHNPGIAALASALCQTAPDHPRFHDYPTGSTLVAHVDTWPDLGLGMAQALDFFVPRDLPGHP